MEIPAQLNQSDHDLLIRLDQSMKNVVDEMRLMRDDNARRLNAVEENKLNITTFNEHRVQVQADMLKMETSIKTMMIERTAARDKEVQDLQKCDDDQAKTIKSILRYVYIGIGISIAISTILSLVGPAIINHLFK